MLHSKICHVSNERTRRPRISKTVSPEHPLEGSDGSHHQALKEHGQSRFPSGKTAIEETNSGNDQPNYKSTEYEVRVMVFQANVLGININLERISSTGNGFVECGLPDVSGLLDVKTAKGKFLLRSSWYAKFCNFLNTRTAVQKYLGKATCCTLGGVILMYLVPTSMWAASFVLHRCQRFLINFPSFFRKAKLLGKIRNNLEVTT
jgi:hypothetical protein